MEGKENIHVWLARRTIKEFVISGKEKDMLKRIMPEETLPEELQKRAGAFVTIKKKGVAGLYWDHPGHQGQPG